MRHLIHLDWADREQEHHLRELIRPLSTEQERKAQRAEQVRTPDLDKPALTAPTGAAGGLAVQVDGDCEAHDDLDAQLELGGLGSSSRRAQSVLGTVRTIDTDSQPTADASFAPATSMLEAGADLIDPLQADEPPATLQAETGLQIDGTPWLLAAMHRPWNSRTTVAASMEAVAPTVEAVAPTVDDAAPVVTELAATVGAQPQPRPQIDGTPWLLAAMHRPWSPPATVPAVVEVRAPATTDGDTPDPVAPDRCEPEVPVTVACPPSDGMPVAETVSPEGAAQCDETGLVEEQRPPMATWVCVGVVPGPGAPSYARVLGYAGPAADELVRGALREFDGTLVRDRPGSFIIEFSNVLAALGFSIHVQETLYGRGEGKHAVRIGVHGVRARSEEHAPLAEALAVRISTGAGDDEIVVSSSAAADVPASAGLELQALPDSVVGDDGAPLALSRLAWR